MRLRQKIRINIDPRGKIKPGYKSKDRGLPKSTDYFVLQHPESEKVVFPELIKYYGEKPQNFLITFPSDEITDFYNDDMVLYGGNKIKKRICNKSQCTHNLAETICGEKFPADTVSDCVCEKFQLIGNEDKDLKKLACKCDMILKAYILNPNTFQPISPLCYMFKSTSENSADNIISELEKYRKFRGMPFVINVKNVKGVDTSFPIINIFPYVTGKKLIEYNMRMEIEQGKEDNLLAESNDKPDIFDLNRKTLEGKKKTLKKKDSPAQLTEGQTNLTLVDVNENPNEDESIREAEYTDFDSDSLTPEEEEAIQPRKLRLDKCETIFELREAIDSVKKGLNERQQNAIHNYFLTLCKNFK